MFGDLIHTRVIIHLMKSNGHHAATSLCSLTLHHPSILSSSLILVSTIRGWFHLVSPKMLARLAANRFNEIRQIFRQVYIQFSLTLSLPFLLLLLIIILLFFNFSFFLFGFPLFAAIEGFLNRSELCKCSSFYYHFIFLSFHFHGCDC